MALSFDKYLDKVKACWTGKSLGGIIGAPIEGHKAFGTFSGLESFPKKLYANDDLDIQVVWLEMLEEIGSDPRLCDLARYWKERCWYNFSEYGIFLNNYDRGINPPLSGQFNNIFYAESMGCPIRAEIWGLASPLLPKRAMKYAEYDGCLDHSELSVKSEQYWAACISIALVETDIKEVLKKGFNYIQSKELTDAYEFSLRLVKDYESKTLNLKGIWLAVLRDYGDGDCSKMLINFIFTVTALLICEKDFVFCINTCINFGWDADCTAATAGALLGTVYGMDCMPAEWSDRMGKNLSCDVNVRHKSSPIDEFAYDTCLVGIEALVAENRLDLMSGIPSEVLDTVKQKMSVRGKGPSLDYDFVYETAPYLDDNGEGTVKLIIKNRTSEKLDAAAKITVSEHLSLVTEGSLSFSLEKGQYETSIKVKTKDTSLFYDTNLIFIELCANGVIENIKVGFTGLRHYAVYGPYFDIYDKTKHEVCPYRNDEENIHPGLAGVYYAQHHQYISLDEQYVDEQTLLTKGLPDELPFVFKSPTDYFTLSDVTAFNGEAAYYFVRELYSEAETDIAVSIGITAPFILYIDGEKAFESRTNQFFAPRDFYIPINVSKKRRIVLKVIASSPYFKAELSMSVLDSVRDKKVGLSYITNSIIDSKISI